MGVIVVRCPVRATVPLVFMLHYLDDVADRVREADVMVVTPILAASPRTGRSSENQAS